ncbi:LysR family transcriptional regulator [Saxibacter everestensis]|uniref:LysR family transcriptional regulator n=1 Tax=Saxibacter everestensis TaxID=2909229 RepID=A0ABY8QW29_9MICO|nr:LysR family transcriptional regulator [Brevibacteriaceae bacterium ZFBP1038]
MSWTLNQMRTFQALSQRGTMAAAAEALGYSIGAVSQQMAALEASVPRQLFLRDGRNLLLTDAGHVLVRHVEAILNAEAEARAAMSEDEQQQSTELRLGVFGSAAVTLVPRGLLLLQESAPNIRVHTQEIGVDQMTMAVVRGAVDLALGVDYPDAPETPQRGTTIIPLEEEEMLMALPYAADTFEVPSSPARRRKLARESDWILAPPDSYLGRAMRVACVRSGFEPRVVHQVTDSAVAIALAEAGVGITPVARRMLQLRSTKSALMPFPKSTRRRIVLVVRTASLERHSVTAVAEAFKRAAVDEP